MTERSTLQVTPPRTPAPAASSSSASPAGGFPLLPHHKLLAFGVAKELLIALRDAHIRDVTLRDQALRAAKSACLNVAEGAGRVTRADKARAFTVARGEAVEACAAIEIAALLGAADSPDAQRVALLGDKLVAMLTRLIR